MEPRKLNALIFGATGAVGRELVKHLANNNRWGEIVCVVRQELPEWEPIKNRLRIVRVDNLDSLVETEKWNFPNTNSVFCCLGSQTKHGNDTFIKVDKTYPLWIANIALKNSKTHCNEEIKHYSLVSSVGSNPNSWFLYPRTKGEVQVELQKKQLPALSIMRPGLLLNRYDPRFGERIAGCLPGFPKIDVKDVAVALALDAQRIADFDKKGVFLYENAQMLNIIGQ